MKLNDIFLKDVARSIEGVVKADDAENLAVEVEEYVLTNDAAKGVAPLLEEYTNYTNANGVWISGFFGSGKSHLLKMLAHLLGNVEGQAFPRERVSELFSEKTGDAMLRASLQKAASIPAKSLLFNIDQKATLISKDQTDALLKVFVKVFDESRGYFGNDGAVARFESDLDRRGQYEAFKEAFGRRAGIPWSRGREQTALEGHNIDAAFEEVNGRANPGIIGQYQKSYGVSIEDFAVSVAEWLDAQEPGYRLNFFVDEVGQFIADDVKLMLNLQTIAESLNTACRGRAWVFVTSQEDMEKVLGDRTKQQGNDFSKIQARFAVKVKLTSQDVEEVISKRLLEKNEAGTAALSRVYSEYSEDFSTLFSFAEGAKTYRNYVDEAHFIGAYPFVTYQIPMFQSAIEGLSDHNMFEGRNSSVGERSMLGVVQEVAKAIGSEQVGYLATFDQMFAGIRASLKSAAQSAILQAERHLPDPNSEVTVLANRLLKALFLVKYVDTFKATPRNLTILVYDRFGFDLKTLRTQVQSALDLLESQSYVQRNGNVYEYLTNEEQEIEKEIKATEIDPSEVSSRLFRMISSDVLKASKLKYAKNGQDFPFAYKLDDVVHGPHQELTIHFITPESGYAAEDVLTRSFGVDELRVVLSADRDLLRDLRLLLKTEKYIKHRTNSGTLPSTQAILQSKQLLNAERAKELMARMNRAVGASRMIINGSEVTSTSTDALSHVTDGFQELIGRTYSQLALLGGRTYSETRVVDVAHGDEGLIEESTVSALKSAAAEVEAWVLSLSRTGEQVTIKKIVDHFDSKPYGWDLGSIEVVVASLVRESKVVLSIDANPIRREDAPGAIRNTSRHAHVVVVPQKAFDPRKVSSLRGFCSDFFDEGQTPSDPVELARYAKDELGRLAGELEGIVARDGRRYPFLDGLAPVIENLKRVATQGADWFLEGFDAADELLEHKEDWIDPIKAFTNGPQAQIFNEAARFLREQERNLSYMPTGRAKDIVMALEDPNAFRGKMNRVKVDLDQLKGEMEDLVAAKRAEVGAAIEDRKSEIEQSAKFFEARPAAREEAIRRIDRVIAAVRADSLIPSILQRGSDFEDEEYPKIVGLLDAVAPGEGPTPPVKAPPISVKKVRVDESGIIESASDVEEYLEKLRRALIRTLDEGKRITY
ncbi:BREX system P-loop protein BrxC [Actinomyces sp. B33]|uniref:BREX system P-loop protein BrxC n=1 Tax=Actinomyces sp. B33 TaxID=2942131 RepID=UPI002341A559|nr:BREX system P-loop protein BrxC [Actinomyces sp. B33]MDC4232439.1 BREX system P-loop protein BrxC [Actinomyces sp. B33]